MGKVLEITVAEAGYRAVCDNVAYDCTRIIPIGGSTAVFEFIRQEAVPNGLNYIILCTNFKNYKPVGFSKMDPQGKVAPKPCSIGDDVDVRIADSVKDAMKEAYNRALMTF